MKHIISIIIVAVCCLSASAIKYKTVKDVTYRTDSVGHGRERCKLDIYYPADTAGCPVVVWFHGGSLTGGNKSIPSELKNKGLTVVAVNYRLMPGVTVDKCIDDAAAAIAWTMKNISRYGGDPRKIFASGHSAGGYLVNMVGFDRRWLRAYGEEADSLAAIVPFSGQSISHFTYRESIGIDGKKPVIDEYAPLYYVRPDCPPVVLISGDREMELLGRYEETAYLWRMFKVNGHPDVTLYELDGFNHSDMKKPACHILLQHIQRLTSPHKKKK